MIYAFPQRRVANGVDSIRTMARELAPWYRRAGGSRRRGGRRAFCHRTWWPVSPLSLGTYVSTVDSDGACELRCSIATGWSILAYAGRPRGQRDRFLGGHAVEGKPPRRTMGAEVEGRPPKRTERHTPDPSLSAREYRHSRGPMMHLLIYHTHEQGA
ncbi:hypothetical protein GGS23DRAFT_584418 [Durotheca rogersii]|uniref:uncharacterized protein n=1 Tax=Durotheca rogersii TaxID=419775 RepID=UPI002220C61A|nr:uncharacterized protein GGS23DRAFT_584418 [Durotheca rogersii]KAI5859638.1 hypothetical protein GGS23DRAFT_584418 [Durotheca rogersii]